MDTKKRIYLKASEMFIDQGYDSTPMSQIAREIGISKAGLYHHHPCKESLLFDVIDYFNKKNFIPIYEAAIKISDPEKRLLFFLEKFIVMMYTDASARISVHEANKLEPAHFNEIKKSWQMTYGLLKDAISEMQASGKVKKINSSFATFAAIGMCSWMFYWIDYSRKDSPEELIETFLEIFMRGITK